MSTMSVGLVTRSDLHLAILRRFRAAGIVIPYLQRDVRIRDDPRIKPGDEQDAEGGKGAT